MTQYDPFTGMPLPGDMPDEAPKMSGLASLSDYGFTDPQNPTMAERVANYRSSPFGYLQKHYREAPKDFYNKYDAQQAEQDITPDPHMPWFTAGPQQMGKIAAAQDWLPEGLQATVPDSASGMLINAGLGAGMISRFLPGAAQFPARVGALVLGGLGASMDEAQADPRGMLTRAAGRAAGKMGGVADQGVMNWLPVTPKPYLIDPQRTFAPGIYKDPRIIAAEANARLAPEHPALKELFGVDRQDLWEIGKRGTRKGNAEPDFSFPEKARGSYMAENIMTPANAQRQIDILAEAQKYPGLIHGGDAWYVMDPAFWEMVKLSGYNKAVFDYNRFNNIMSPFSTNSTVLKEINRGTTARMMADRGEWEKFAQHGGTPVEARAADFPAEMADLSPHLRHGNQYPPVERWLQTGSHLFHPDTVKNPAYVLASGVPATGFQTRWAVPDAHLARGTGMADVRTTQNPGISMKGKEYRQFAPWYREEVAAPLGIEAVPAQGRQWGVMAPQTGVDTPIGAPKLELLAQRIWERAKEKGIDPKALRDAVLTGKAHASWLLPSMVMGGAAALDNYRQPRGD